jgi:hypothetical protein
LHLPFGNAHNRDALNAAFRIACFVIAVEQCVVVEGRPPLAHLDVLADLRKSIECLNRALLLLRPASTIPS